MFKVGDKVRVIHQSLEWRKYIGSLLHRKGRIVEILENSHGEKQGARVRFAGGKEWAFYWKELERR